MYHSTTQQPPSSCKLLVYLLNSSLPTKTNHDVNYPENALISTSSFQLNPLGDSQTIDCDRGSTSPLRVTETPVMRYTHPSHSRTSTRSSFQPSRGVLLGRTSTHWARYASFPDWPNLRHMSAQKCCNVHWTDLVVQSWVGGGRDVIFIPIIKM